MSKEIECSRCGTKIKAGGYYESDMGVILCEDCYLELEATLYGLGETEEDLRAWKWKEI